ncbi:hypothetical protein J4205_03795 [Candidatus Pacearchaeota archaeon]|nr:hypothetical protein [Candidatus Pacearchaeota archaeon]
MEYSYYDDSSFYTRLKIPPTTFERKALVEKIKGKNFIMRDFENKDISFNTLIHHGNVFETVFIIFTNSKRIYLHPI